MHSGRTLFAQIMACFPLQAFQMSVDWDRGQDIVLPRATFSLSRDGERQPYYSTNILSAFATANRDIARASRRLYDLSSI